MNRGMVGRLRSLVVVGVVTSAVVFAIVITTSNGAQASTAAKAGPVVGQLVLAGGQASSVTAYSWGVTAESHWMNGGASIGTPNPGAIHFTKLFDSSSIATLQKIASGNQYPSAVFTTTFGKGNNTSTMVYEMAGLLVTSVTQGAADGLLTEDVSFAFKTVTWTFTDPSGNATTGTWDISTGLVS